MYRKFGLNYNYQFRFNENNVLSAGLSFNIETINWARNWLPPANPNDPVLPPQSGSETATNLGAGLLYKNRNWFVGASMNPIVKLSYLKLDFADKYNYNFILGAEAPLSEKLDLYSTLFVSTYMDASYTSNFMAQLIYNKIVFVGGGFTFGDNFSGDSWQALFGFRITQKFRLQYSFGRTLSDLKNSNISMHNIAFQFVLPSSRNKK